MRASVTNRDSNFGPRPKAGYLLLVVLAVIVLVITVLGMLAKVSLRRGVQSADAQLALQQRWGVWSLERALLDEAPKVFALRDQQLVALGASATPPPPLLRGALSLGGVTFDLMIADEDAKLNLNSIYHHAGLMEVQQAIGELVPPVGRGAIRLQPVVGPQLLSTGQSRVANGPRAATIAGVGQPETEQGSDDPSANPAGLSTVPMAFRSWGEVFDLALLATAVGSEAALPNLTTEITCWGTGQLNIRRAADPSILAVFRSVIPAGSATRMLKRYRDNPAADLAALLVTEVRDNRDREQLTRLLAEVSTHYSLWIDASIATGRPLRRLVLMQRDEEGVTRREGFSL